MPAGTTEELLGLPPAVFAAVIAASVAVVVAVYGQYETFRRERAARRYTQRRTAILELQESLLDLRTELRAYAAALLLALDVPSALPGVVSPLVDSTALRRAEGSVDVRLVRLDDSLGHRPVAAAARSWRETAQEHFLSPASVHASVEQQAWDAFNEQARRTLSAKR